MIKVCSIMDPKYRFVIRRHRSFFKHAPDFISCTTDPEQADIFLSHMACNGDSGCGHFNFPASEEVFFHNRTRWTKLLAEVEQKPCIFFTEGQVTEWPSWLREFDMVCRLPTCPPHPNLLTSMGMMCEIVDETDFYQNQVQTERIYQAAMMNTHEHIHLVAKYAKRLVVLGTNNLSDIRDYDSSDSNFENVECMSIPAEQPEKMRDLLNQVEFVITCPIPESKESIGFEALTIEGMFCGAQPVYTDPQGQFQKLHEGLNVKFLDRNRIEDSIREVFESGSQLTQSDIDAGIQRWGCTNRIPAFWEEIRDRLI